MDITHTHSGVEQAVKNWEGEKFRAREIFAAALPLFQFAPHLLGAHAFLPPPSLGHACCDHNESESYRPTIIICRHYVEQQKIR